MWHRVCRFLFLWWTSSAYILRDFLSELQLVAILSNYGFHNFLIWYFNFSCYLSDKLHEQRPIAWRVDSCFNLIKLVILYPNSTWYDPFKLHSWSMGVVSSDRLPYVFQESVFHDLQLRFRLIESRVVPHINGKYHRVTYCELLK